MRGFIITGTDTGVGKTVFAAGLTGWLGADYWKPVQAGLDEESDSETVSRLTGAHIFPEAYRLNTACSPHQAASIDGVMIQQSRLTLPGSDKPLVVEGAGGALVPLSEKLLYADLFVSWGLPVILIARTSLGTINHSLLSLEALRARNITVAGVAFIGTENVESECVITAIGKTAHLGRLPHLDPLEPAALRSAFAANIRTELFT